MILEIIVILIFFVIIMYSNILDEFYLRRLDGKKKLSIKIVLNFDI